MLSVLTRPQSQYAWAIFLAVGTVPEQRQLDSGDEHTKRRESLARSRHIERRYLKMQEWVAEGKIKVKYINTDENRADMFTKPLDRATFEKPHSRSPTTANPVTGLVGQEPSQRWGSLFPLNAWESALPAACRPPQTGPLIMPGPVLPLFLSTPLLQSKS